MTMGTMLFVLDGLDLTTAFTCSVSSRVISGRVSATLGPTITIRVEYSGKMVVVFTDAARSSGVVYPIGDPQP